MKPNRTSIRLGQHLSPTTEFKKGLVPYNSLQPFVKLCKHCGKTVITQRRNLVFCSRLCYRQHHGIRMAGSKNPMYGKATTYRWKYLADKGYWVKSSWEERLIRLFDMWQVNYEYEPEQFRFADFSYTPDFYLPDLGIWVEVKGYMNERSRKRIEAFAREGYKLSVVGPREFEWLNNASLGVVEG